MHQQTMVLLKKSQGSAVAEYAPIAKMLTTLDVVDIALLEGEWEDMAEYAKRYLNLVQEDY